MATPEAGLPEASIPEASIAERQRWISVLALSPHAALERAWGEMAERPCYRLLRAPEIGAAMVRGRIAGTGEPFNLGEMTMTRAAVQVAPLSDGAAQSAAFTGFGHVAGREPRHAELAAVFDALLQDPARRARLVAEVIDPLALALAERRAAQAADVAPSRVEFFTLVRGD